MPKQSWPQLIAFSRKLLGWLQTDLGIAVSLMILWQLVMTTAGYLIDTKLHLPTTGLFADMPEGLLGHTLRWDAGWYMEIIRSGFYQHTSSQGAIFAFYPLYPLLVSLVAGLSLSTLSLPAASFIVTSLAVVAILLAFLKISAHIGFPRRASLFVILLFLASPAAMFLHVFYSEAVFIAIGAWAYLSALRRQWRSMALLLALLTAARLPALLFVALCGLEFVRAHQWSLIRTFRDHTFLWFTLAPLGFIAYSAWAFVASGDPLAMFHAYKAGDGWPYQVFNPNIFATLLHASLDLLRDLHAHGLNQAIVVNSILPLGAIVTLFITSLYALIRGKGVFVPLGVFGLLSILLFTLNSNVVSIHRYSLACLSMFLAIGLAYTRHPRGRWLLALSLPVCAFAQLSLLALFVTGHFAG